MDVRQHTIRIPDNQLSDLQDRLRRVRLPAVIDPAAWDDGAALSFVERLVARWADRFDWRAAERRLNALPNRITTVGGRDIHFVHASVSVRHRCRSS